GPIVLAHSCRLGLEGIISKRKDLAHRSGRGDHWLKAKCRASQEFVILGYVPSTAGSRMVGSLLLGYQTKSGGQAAGGGLAYAGHVGTGWSTALAQSLREMLDNLSAGKPALRKPLPEGAEKGVVWAEPRLVCDVEYRDWTADGLIRQSSFKGLREDEAAEAVMLETVMLETVMLETGPKAAKRRPGRAKAEPASKSGIALTHPERILWPEPGITKQGLADFYADIA